ncbi:glutamine amidotransferase [Candidatus Microgenomates bacterium]|nr:glutamine amidotransferase [Candidatus Microgenomates bacterium]
MRKLVIAHLYPQEMNIYGDRGNIIALSKRLQWRGLGAQVDSVEVGEVYDFRQADIVFGGGGQDRGQQLIARDLQKRASNFHQAADEGVVMLTICGTYQLFGHGFITKDGHKLPGIGIFKAQTLGSDTRMIGNVIVKSDFGELVGFENHSGQTSLEPGQEPLGQVSKGFGNNSHDKTEGAVYKNVFGTYLHGPLLPKNPKLADVLIHRAISRKFGQEELKTLDDSLELRAAELAKARPR